MHISDGILSTPVSLSCAAAAIAVAYITARKIKQEDVPEIAVMTAAFFVASLVHVKIGPSSAHLVLNGMVGVLLGYAAFPAILVGLLFQAMMFQHGGLTSLGANALIMGLPALLAAFFYRLISTSSGFGTGLVSFLTGAMPVMISAALAAVFLMFSGEEFYESAKIIGIMNIPIAFVEGAVTVFAVSFLRRVRPQLFY